MWVFFGIDRRHTSVVLTYSYHRKRTNSGVSNDDQGNRSDRPPVYETVHQRGYLRHGGGVPQGDLVDYTPLGKTTDRDAVSITTKEMRTAFPDSRIITNDIVADDDTVAVRLTRQGTHDGVFMGNEPTGRSFEVEAMGFANQKDGKIVERRVGPDIFWRRLQLGLEVRPAAEA